MASKLLSEDEDDELLIKGVVFASREEARDWLLTLKRRGLVSRNTYVEHTTDKPTHTFIGGNLGVAAQ